MSCPKALLLSAVAGLLFAAIPAGRAIQWRSTYYKCVVDLPETSPITGAWAPMTSSGAEDESGMVAVAGSRRIDYSGYVFLGVIRLDQKPGFQLNEKTISELDKRYFGTGLGFLHSIQPLRRKDGLPAYRLTGTVEGGKAVPSSIAVTAGRKTGKYKSVDDVPEEHRAAVRQLLSSVGGGR